MFDWSQEVVLITGASSGIGHALAVELGRKGASLGLLARRAETLREIAEEVEGVGGHALALPADVRDAEAVREAANQLREKFGRVDVLVANAGVGVTTDAKNLQAKEVADVMGINVLGAVNSVTAVLPEMVEQGSGQLVAISSLAAYRGLPKSAAYCASKAALSAFFESLRVDLRESGVNVTIIHPGFIKTPLTAGRHAQMPYLMELDDAIKKIIRAIETRKKSYAFPWQLATISRIGMLLPPNFYDRIIAKRSYRE
ncbi:MAG TPA: SDR family NAD(P)-dependent oxidoreductase [Pyrinomonadaceae bacterium]|jgi:short-subunit dehydrogenase|nr:SDR family NAD(P)-dependent oxidoreductase [Pyrinomonadaceae bacterium]